jgi:hypothetical protein
MIDHTTYYYCHARFDRTDYYYHARFDRTDYYYFMHDQVT